MNLIPVSVKRIGERMIEAGYTDDIHLDGWSNTLLEVMEEEYSLETDVMDYIKGIAK